MNERASSLELPEVSRRFAESERLLNEARESLSAIIKSESRSQGHAESLAESAGAVAQFSARAEALLRETESVLHEAGVVLQTSSDVNSRNAERVAAVHERILELTGSHSELLAAVNTEGEARQAADESTDKQIHALQKQVTDLQGGVVGNRTASLAAAGVLLAAQVVVLILVVFI